MAALPPASLSWLAAWAGPAAIRYRDIDGVVGLQFGREGLDRKLGRGQRLRIEALCDVGWLVGRFRIALGGREAEPLEGFGEVLFDTDAAGIKDAEIELAIGDAAVGGLAEPLRRALVVAAVAAAIGVQHREIVHRLGVAAF